MCQVHDIKNYIHIFFKNKFDCLKAVWPVDIVMEKNKEFQMEPNKFIGGSLYYDIL